MTDAAANAALDLLRREMELCAHDGRQWYVQMFSHLPTKPGEPPAVITITQAQCLGFTHNGELGRYRTAMDRIGHGVYLALGHERNATINALKETSNG